MRPWRPEWQYKYSSTLSLTSALNGEGVGQRQAPAVFTSRKETRHPSYRKLGRSQGRSGRLRKTPPWPGYDPRTDQPVAYRYSDWAIPAFLTPNATSENPTFSSQTVFTCQSDVKKNWKTSTIFVVVVKIIQYQTSWTPTSAVLESYQAYRNANGTILIGNLLGIEGACKTVNGQFPSTPAVCAGS